MATKVQPGDCQTVQIFHEKCGGWWFWSVDMPGCRNDIKKAVVDATRNGDRVVWYPPGATSEGHACSCEWPQVKP